MNLFLRAPIFGGVQSGDEPRALGMNRLESFLPHLLKLRNRVIKRQGRERLPRSTVPNSEGNFAMKIPLPPRDYLCKRLKYELETGKVYWLHRDRETFNSSRIFKSWNAMCEGKEAFNTIRPDGYLKGCIDGVNYLTHRIIWAMHYDKEPDQIDHVDGVRTNNRLANLRDVCHRENGMNIKIGTLNTSGHIGVYWESALGKWRAQINIRGKTLKLGCFTEKTDAISARKAAEVEYGFHPNHGKPS